jgi:hypothetical protein
MIDTIGIELSEAPNADIMPNRLDRLAGIILSIRYLMLLAEGSARKKTSMHWSSLLAAQGIPSNLILLLVTSKVPLKSSNKARKFY